MEGGARVTSPETSTAISDAAATASLPAGLRLGPAHLTVTDLDRSVAFYGDVVGLRVHRREGAAAALGGGEGEEALVLVEEPGAAAAGRHAGLYHVALLYPSREELAHAVGRIAVTHAPIEGASDHGTHEAIYLSDPDRNGQIINGLFGLAPPTAGASAGPPASDTIVAPHASTSTACSPFSPARSRVAAPSPA